MADKYVFIAEWFDAHTSLNKRFELTFFEQERAVKLFDLQAQKLFLQKTPVTLELRDFRRGNEVEVLSRRLRIVDYALPATKAVFEERVQRTFTLVREAGSGKWGDVVRRAEEEGFAVELVRMRTFTALEAEEFYADLRGKLHFREHVDQLVSAAAMGIVLSKQNAVDDWLAVVGPTDAALARRTHPSTIRGLWAATATPNAVHVSESAQSAERETALFLGGGAMPALPRSNVTLVVVKPHIIRERKLGDVVRRMLPEFANCGLSVLAADSFTLTRAQAEEFLEIYRDVLPDFANFAGAVADGLLVAMAVGGDADVVQRVRELVGPHDARLAKSTRPKTLRALFGHDSAQNALHCTDLVEDGSRECDFFFELLRKTAA